MSIPLRWASGDRCFARGRLGTVRRIVPTTGSRRAWVDFDDGAFALCRLDELDLVPFAEGAS